jgi:hypothetical protein
MTIPTNLGGTGTYTFAPSAADLVLYAYSLINMRPTELTTQHFIDAGMAANFAMIDMSNRNPMRFAMETVPVPLTSTTATYSLPNRTLAVSIVTIATGSGATLVERTIGPISAYEYAATPTKAQAGPPTSYFFSLLAVPTITFWPTPDAGGPYVANVQTFRQLQDIDLTNSQGVDSPYRFLDALCTSTAARLAESYKPEKAPALYAQADARMRLAQGRDQESTPITIAPALRSYFRIL